MLLEEYVAKVTNASTPKDAMNIGIDENLQIAFQDQSSQLDTLFRSIGANYQRKLFFKYGISQCLIEVRDQFRLLGNESVLNPNSYTSVVNFFHAFPLVDYDAGVLDMRKVVLACMNFGLTNKLSVVVNYNTSTGAVFIPSSPGLLRE